MIRRALACRDREHQQHIRLKMLALALDPNTLLMLNGSDAPHERWLTLAE